MIPYNNIAPVYDFLLQHVDYPTWYKYIRKIMMEYTPKQDIIVELGCGTGKFGAKFSADGYSIYGIDYSIEMLRVANARAFKNFRIICSDMRNFHLSKKADFIFSIHDTMNYFTTISDIKKVLSSVKGIMHEDTIFMFDITTEYNIYKNFKDKTLKYKFMGKKILWSNTFDKDKKEVVSTIKIIGEDKKEFVENHLQRIYSIEEIEEVLLSKGFEVMDIFSDYTFLTPDNKTVMINFITRKSR